MPERHGCAPCCAVSPISERRRWSRFPAHRPASTISVRAAGRWGDEEQARWEDDMTKASNAYEPDVKVRTREFKIGCIGAGMIMAECHLAAYKEAGFPVVAIASRTKANAEKVA